MSEFPVVVHEQERKRLRGSAENTLFNKLLGALKFGANGGRKKDSFNNEADLDGEIAKRALDELFTLTNQYRFTQDYLNLLDFVSRFHFYAPFNAMLIHIQSSGATYVCSPKRWLRDYKRRINPGARPLVILQPRGPVMFVFDVSDTYAEKDAPPLPSNVDRPFEVSGESAQDVFSQTVENAKRDGVRVTLREAGSQHAGSICRTDTQDTARVQAKYRPTTVYTDVPIRYEVVLNASHSVETRYATLVHELAHLYCGHIGSPNLNWWPERGSTSEIVREFEAESVSYLVCKRLGLNTSSEKYLAGYQKDNAEAPAISLDCVMVASGLIEKMGRKRLDIRSSKGIEH